MEKLLYKLSDEMSNEKINLADYGVDLDKLFCSIIKNKIIGIAYDKIIDTFNNRELRKAFISLYEKNLQSTDIFYDYLIYLSGLLSSCKFRYALLKGAFLTTQLYKKGHRTSNDIDILINKEDITELQELLKNNGFVQGKYDLINKVIVPASRKEIINSRMNYGETIPFLKLISGNLLEVDINFSVDYKPSEDNSIVSELLNSIIKIPVGNTYFYTLDSTEFLIHLCCHLYKEATTYNWVKTQRDLMLYKFSDINVFLHKFASADFFEKLRLKIKELGLEKSCYYTFENSSVIYPNLNKIVGFEDFKNMIRPEDTGFMKEIVNPQEKCTLYYDMDFRDWFACENRAEKLLLKS